MSTELNGSSDAINVKPIIQWPDDKQAATFLYPVCCSHSVLCHSLHSRHIAYRTAPAQPSPKKKKETFKQRPGTRTYGQNFGQVWQGNLSKQKHSIGQKKSQKLNNAGKLRGIYHIDPEDKEFNDPPENGRITLNCSWTPQCHVNCERQQGIHSKRRLRTDKTKFALSSGMERILAKNSQKKQTNYVTKVRPTTNLQESKCKRPTTEIMKITLLKRGTIRRDIVILCTDLFFCSKQSWMRRPQLTKNGRAEELPITARIKSQKQTRSYRAGTEKVKNSSLRNAHGLMPPQKLQIGQEVPNI